MRDFLKWGLLGGGVLYFFFHEQIAAAFAAPGATQTPATTTTPGAAATTTTPASKTGAATEADGTKARILAAVKDDANYIANNGRMSAFQWNFYYRLVRGVDAKDPSELGISDPAMLISLDEYWTVATAHGLAGLRPNYRRRSLAAAAWEL